MQLSLTVDGHKQVSRNLRVLAREIPQLKAVFDEILDLVQARTQQMFSASGSNITKAGSWPPLSAKTIQARDRRWGYYKNPPNRPGLLRWTGALQDQVTRQTSDSRGEMVHTARSSKGFNYPLAHQRGGGHLPQRVVIDISPATIAEIDRAFQGHIQRTIGIFGRQV